MESVVCGVWSVKRGRFTGFRAYPLNNASWIFLLATRYAYIYVYIYIFNGHLFVCPNHMP